MTSSPPILLLAGPPFGPALWREVAKRLPGATAPSLLDGEGAADLEATAQRATTLARWSDAVVVAHGTAVPLAIAAACLRPPAALVLSNGPVRHLDPATLALSRLAATGALPLHPAIWTRLLASSFGLRRAVANPYVMDRDTVVLLCGPLVATSAQRSRLRTYYRSLGQPLPNPLDLRCPVGLVWGTEDRLNPLSEADWLEASPLRAARRDVAGGRWLHPEERPWAFADAVLEVVAALELSAPAGHKSHA